MAEVHQDRKVFGIPYPEFVKETESAFFVGMMRGWAFDHKGEPHPVLKGWKRNLTIWNKFQIIDEWCDDSGRTIINRIYIDELAHLHPETPPVEIIPAWVMRYFGNYPPEAIPCLKAALGENYIAKKFQGGRGASHFTDPSNPKITYANYWKGDFMRFHGWENVVDFGDHAQSSQMGSHQFWGGILI